MRTWLILAVLWLAAFVVSPARAQMDAGNVVGQVLPSITVNTTTVNSPDQTNQSWHGLTLVINVSSITSGTCTPQIQGKDPVSGAYFLLLSGPTINSNTVYTMTVFPGITAAASTAAATILPQTWRLQLQCSSPNMVLSATALLQQ